MAEIPTDLLAEQSKTLPGHGLTVFKVYDTKSKKATVLKAKLQGKELLSVLDSDNELDLTTHFKVKRGTKEYGVAILERTIVAFREGALKVDIDWTNIRRIQIEAAIRAEKIAETKRKNEEERVAREKQKEEERLAEEMRQLQLQKEEAKRIQKEKEAQELKLKLEKQRIEKEAQQQRRAFEDKIGNAILNGGVLHLVPKHDENESKDESNNAEIIKTWSDEHKCYYFTNVETNILTWRDPRIESVWEKEWDVDLKSFKFVNKLSKEVLYKEPYSSRFDKIWNESKNLFQYINISTGES